MTENEQIEEMARDLCECYIDGVCYQDNTPCDLRCEEYTNSEYLYSKGYRKASEVAREIFEDIENVLSENFHADCIMGDCVVDYYDDNLRDDIAELKKKYGGTNNDGE